MYIEYNCKFCGKLVRKQKNRHKTQSFCDNRCKSEWQKTQKPVDKEWLIQKYIVEGLSCYEIAPLVNRNPKQVYEWLKGYNIPTRPRGSNTDVQFKKGQQSAMKGLKHSEETKEKIRQARLRDGIVPYLNKDGTHAMKGRTGANHPKWKGGFTPERQAVYGSQEWKDAVKIVWKRDNATCQRCGLHRSEARKEDIDFDIHHIVSFAVKELRCETSNLILLCETCHHWVHSNDNINKELISEYNNDGI